MLLVRDVDCLALLQSCASGNIRFERENIYGKSIPMTETGIQLSAFAETPNVYVRFHVNRKIFIVDSDLWAQISITHVINTMLFIFYAGLVHSGKMRQTNARFFSFRRSPPHSPLCCHVNVSKKKAPNIAFYVKLKELIELGVTSFGCQMAVIFTLNSQIHTRNKLQATSGICNAFARGIVFHKEISFMFENEIESWKCNKKFTSARPSDANIYQNVESAP